MRYRCCFKTRQPGLLFSALPRRSARRRSRPAQRCVQTKMQVRKPDDKIPNPVGTGAVQTNGDTVISYLNEICKDAHPTVVFRRISVDNYFCNGTATGADGKPISKIQQSKTPAGCSCICEMAASPNTFKIAIDDAADPDTSADDLNMAGLLPAPAPPSR